MRVGICCFPSFWGSGVVASELALALAESGDSVHVVSSTRPPRLPEASGVHHHPVDGSGILEYGLFEHPPYTLALANRLAQVAQDCLLDLIHVHYAAPHAVAALLARQMLAQAAGGPRACPVVTTVHGTDVTLVGAHPSYSDIVGWALRGSDCVTVPSHALQREVTERFALDDPVEVIPNFVPVARDPVWRAASGITGADNGLGPAVSDAPLERGMQIVHISNFRPVKRLADVVAAFALVRRQLPARLCLVGDGVRSATWRRWRGAALPCSATLHAVRLSAGTVVVGPAPASTAARSWRDTGRSTALHWLSEAPPHTGPARRSM